MTVLFTDPDTGMVATKDLRVYDETIETDARTLPADDEPADEPADEPRTLPAPMDIQTIAAEATGAESAGADPCADPLNADSDYCRERRPGESIEQWQQRSADALEVPITRGASVGPAGVPWLVWGIGAALVAYSLYQRR